MSGKRPGRPPTIQLNTDVKAKGSEFGVELIRKELGGSYVVDSELSAVAYAVQGKFISIVTPQGEVRMLRKNAEIIASELLGVIDDADDLRLDVFKKGSCYENV